MVIISPFELQSDTSQLELQTDTPVVLITVPPMRKTRDEFINDPKNAYKVAIERAGAVARFIDLDEYSGTSHGRAALTEELLNAQAVLLPGGNDIDPMTYGEEFRHETLEPTSPASDDKEIFIVQRARDFKIPVLGICRGAQIINVAHDGSLEQHLPDIIGDESHSYEQYHDITITPGSKLANTVLAHELNVNSLHHQAIQEVGMGLKVVARSPKDDVIEGIEAAQGWMLGVQWHAELMTDEPSCRLFQSLVHAAVSRSDLGEGHVQAA